MITKPENVLEKQVQDSIEALLDDLIKKGKPIYYWRSNAGEVFSIGKPKPFISHIVDMAIRRESVSNILKYCWSKITKILLAPKGHSDYSGCFAGKPVFIECKRMKGGRLSPEQIAFRARVESCGGVYLLCNTAEPLREYLRMEGLL